jgi:hypothetical protein
MDYFCSSPLPKRPLVNSDGLLALLAVASLRFAFFWSFARLSGVFNLESLFMPCQNCMWVHGTIFLQQPQTPRNNGAVLRGFFHVAPLFSAQDGHICNILSVIFF